MTILLVNILNINTLHFGNLMAILPKIQNDNFISMSYRSFAFSHFHHKKKLPSPGTRSEHGAKRKELISTNSGRISLRLKIVRKGLPGYHSH